MPTPPNADYKKRQRISPRSTLWHGYGRSRAHPDRSYLVDDDGTIWRADKYRARFGGK